MWACGRSRAWGIFAAGTLSHHIRTGALYWSGLCSLSVHWVLQTSSTIEGFRCVGCLRDPSICIRAEA
jgi:hypothetical protein